MGLWFQGIISLGGQEPIQALLTRTRYIFRYSRQGPDPLARALGGKIRAVLQVLELGVA